MSGFWGNNRFKKKLRVSHAYFLNSLPFFTIPENKFLIFGQGRSGSTLLVDLLNSHPNIHCDKEIFNYAIFTGEKINRPYQYISGRSKRFENNVYGFKVKIYQLIEDHMVDPFTFLNQLNKEGWKIIFLKRENPVYHAFSNIKRRATGVTHINHVTAKKSAGKIHLETQEFIDEINYRISYRKKEEEILSEIPHLMISYEEDLANGKCHQSTANRIFDYLGISKVNVTSKSSKISNKSLMDMVENKEELHQKLVEYKLDKYV